MEIFTSRSRHPKTLEIDPETGKKKRQQRSSNAEVLPITNHGGSGRVFFKFYLNFPYSGFI